MYLPPVWAITSVFFPCFFTLIYQNLWNDMSLSTHHVKVYYGLLKEPEIELPLDDEDEEAENEEGKPKKKKPKKDSMGSKSKKQDPNAPSQNR